MKIVTNYIYPPIPMRCFDWHATIEGREEEGINGFGKTEQEAIEDLKQLTENYTNDKLTKGQFISLNHHLSAWPEIDDFEHIIALIKINDRDIVIWEPFHEFDTDRILESIDRLADDIDNYDKYMSERSI